MGLETGGNPSQLEVEQAVVDAFNASHPGIQLLLEVVPRDQSWDVLAGQIAAGQGPDIVGPIQFTTDSRFYGQWLDLAPYVASTGYDLAGYNPALVSMYQIDGGLISIPFAVYPSATFFVPALFDAAGLSYPPRNYGEPYIMPDGTPQEWSWETLGQVARLLTLDAQGRNATSAVFDPGNIVQYGYSPAWQNHPIYIGTFWGAGSPYRGSAGAYSASIPEAWKAAWQWLYDGIWGTQPFIPDGPANASTLLNEGNTLASGRIAMTVNNSWYYCCLEDLMAAGKDFEFAALPSYQGQVHGRVDAYSFRIWRGSQHPEEAFDVLAYLSGPQGAEPLLVGGERLPAYGAVPALPQLQPAHIAALTNRFPFVDNWGVLLAGLSYPDVPSADAFVPNYDETWSYLDEINGWLHYYPGLDLPWLFGLVESDLTDIFNQ